MSTNFSAEKEFIKDRQRYINIAINSDKRIQILMLVFIIDSHEYILAGQTGGIISLYKDFPKEIMLDLKDVLYVELEKVRFVKTSLAPLKKITVPESIVSGFGPECVKKLNF